MVGSLVLIVLDGWGIAPPGSGNAITLAKTPFYDSLLKTYLNTMLHADGPWVGLPEGEVGSSETGHLTIGAGRAGYRDHSRINASLKDGSFFKNEALRECFEKAQKTNHCLHLMGLGSLGGVHAHRLHLYGLLELAKRMGFSKDQVKIHIFSDGRDTDPFSGINFAKESEEVLAQKQVGVLASIMGRYWAMDRDRRWERTQKAYEALVEGKAVIKDSANAAFADAYKKGVTDEFIEPAIIADSPKKAAAQIVKDGDSVVHFNFRTDRARQLTEAFVRQDFYQFERRVFLPNLHFVSFVEFEKGLKTDGVAFPPITIKNTLGEVLSRSLIKQARVAESEKFAFVTYYFNGLCEECIGTEENFLIPSPKISTYDLKPEMSTPQVVLKVSQLIEIGRYPFILVNFANPDMVGHTGVLSAGIKAVESVDTALRALVEKALSKETVCLITADHGNVEQMIDLETGQIDTKHNPHPVPFIAVGEGFKRGKFKCKIRKGGSLADVAPTVLQLMGIDKPLEMTGTSLL